MRLLFLQFIDSQGGTHVIEISKKNGDYWRFIETIIVRLNAINRDLSPIILIVNHGIITAKHAPNPNRLGLCLG